jgi:hypothetical protein
MRLPDRVLNTACLLGFKKETPQYAGTGLVVAVPGAHGNSHLYPAHKILEVINQEELLTMGKRNDEKFPYVLPQCWPLLKGVKCSPSL